MSLSKKTSYMLAVGGTLLATSGYLAVRQYMTYKDLRENINSIPWDVPKEYKSWKSFFRVSQHSTGKAAKGVL